ncbi:MAG: glycosyltransferase family 2 protein [Bacilli bacterium]|nr:glycosyltransferase family 2 protein [Bacilli bacterium]
MKKKNEALVSVIISTFNRKDYIGKAIDSVLMQTYKEVEIIIIDDYSSDGTGDYIKENYNLPNIHYYRNEKNLGCGISRKKAMTYAKGKYINFLDDDDRFIDKTYFETAVKRLEKEKNLAIVCGSHIVYDVINEVRTEKKFPYKDTVDKRELFIHFSDSEYPKPIISVAIIRRKALEKAKYEEMKILNDTTIFLRVILFGDMGFIKKPQAEYLVHGNNISFNCKTDFIIDNLDEKYKVFKIVENSNKYTKEELDKWLEKQLDITIIYFINGSKPNYFNFRKIIKWYKNNVGNSEKIKEFKKIYKEGKRKSKEI